MLVLLLLLFVGTVVTTILFFVLGTWYCEAICMLCRYIEC
jgi:hypothetical protein